MTLKELLNTIADNKSIIINSIYNKGGAIHTILYNNKREIFDELAIDEWEVKSIGIYNNKLNITIE